MRNDRGYKISTYSAGSSDQYGAPRNNYSKKSENQYIRK